MSNSENKAITRSKPKGEGKRRASTFFVMEVKESETGEILSFTQLPKPTGVPSNSEGKTAAIKKALKESIKRGEDTYKGKRIAIMFMNCNVFHFGPKPGPAELVILED